jgi:rubredoxin
MGRESAPSMEDTPWTGVTLTYLCPSCGSHGKQLFVHYGVGLDMDKARQAAWEDRSPCRSCNEPLSDNLPFRVDITPASLEELRKAGFPAPPAN